MAECRHGQLRGPDERTHDAIVCKTPRSCAAQYLYRFTRDPVVRDGR